MTVVSTAFDVLSEAGDPSGLLIKISAGAVFGLVGLLTPGSAKVEAAAEDPINSLIRKGDFKGAIEYLDKMTYLPDDVREDAKRQVEEIAQKALEHYKKVQDWNRRLNELIGDKSFDEAIKFVRDLDIPIEEKSRIASGIEGHRDHLRRVERFNELLARRKYAEARRMVDEFDHVPKDRRKKIKKDLRRAARLG